MAADPPPKTIADAACPETATDGALPVPEPVLDEAVLVALEQDLSAALMPEVVATFVEEVTARVAAIRQAAATGDGATAAAQAHGLKGSAATFGARALGISAQAIEAAGQAGDLTPVQTLLARLPAQGQAVIAALRCRHPAPDREPADSG